jgi:hypothetical protein
VIARVVQERRAAGLNPAQDVDFLGLTLAAQAELGLTDRQMRVGHNRYCPPRHPPHHEASFLVMS